MPKPLYMWAGGKNKMIPKYLETPTIPKTGFDTFVEPFFGGGAMTIWVYQNCPNVKKFIINDHKQELMGIYKAIRDDLEPFLKRMDDLSFDYLAMAKPERKLFYYGLRQEYITDYKHWTPTYEAATLYFLLKTAFNGIWQTTKNSNGRFATPCGLLNQKDSVYDKHNVLEWHKFLQLAEIHNDDWAVASQNVEGKAFFFMDPPYRESFTSYGSVFDDKEHIRLIDFCKTQDANGHYVYYCNRDDSNDGFFDTHRGNLLSHHYDIKYTAGRRSTNSDGSKSAKSAKEILLYSSSIEPIRLC